MPVASILIIAANIAAAFVTVFNPSLWIELGFNPRFPAFRTALTSMFVHLNLLHLLGNMLFLAAVGAAVELAAGVWRFILVYFVGGLAGVVAHWIVFARALEPPILVGASAGVAACVGYYSVRYSRLRVPLAPHVGISVSTITAVWAGLQVLGALVRLGDADASVAYWAHLAGLVAGLVLSLIFGAPRLAELALGHEVLREMNERSPGAALTAASVHLGANPNDPRGLQEAADALGRLGDSDEEAKVQSRLAEVLPEGEADAALARLSELGRLDLVTSLRRTFFAERLATRSPELAEALLLSVVEGPANDPQRPEAMLALAGLVRSERPETARNVLERLAKEYPLHPAVEVARTRGWAS